MKRKMNSFFYMFIILSIAVGVFSGGITQEVEASEINNSDNKISILLHSETNMQNVIEIINDINEDIKIQLYPEIGLMSLAIPEEINDEEILLNRELNDIIENWGHLGKIVQSREDLGATCLKNDVEINFFNNIFKRKSSEQSIFDDLAWHVNIVTNDKKSLKMSRGSDIKIALVDSGIDTSHPYLIDNIDYSNAHSFVEGESNIVDTNGHGTMMAGIIRQVAPDAIITPYKVLGDLSGESLWTIEAIIEAVKDGNDIINLSLGTYKCENIEDEKLTIEAFKSAIQYAEDNNVIVVASIGNSGYNLDQLYQNESKLHLPSEISGVNAVSATHGDSLASYSNYGSNTKFCAPGGDLVYNDGYVDISQWIYCIFPTSMDNGLSSLGIPQGYTFSYGTSLAAPLVTAGIADIISYYSELHSDVVWNNELIIEYLSDGVVDLGDRGRDIYYGYGRINIENSLLKMSE